MSASRSRSLRFLPHSLLATFVVMAVPSLAATVFGPDGPTWLVLLSVLGAMVGSVALASACAALWSRCPGSQDVVFGDLMLWGLLRRLRAERRLAQARELLGDQGAAGGQALSPQQLRETLERLSELLEARDSYTHGHSRRVTRHAERIARELALPASHIAKVRVAAALHDVGKLHTPIEVLRKPGRLTDEEFAVIKRHPVDGADMVAELGDPEITATVRHHHERLDGRGYPDGLSGDDIPLGARIIAVADTFDAITSSRPYRSATQHKKALDVLSKEAGSQLDPDVVAAFKRYYSGRRSIAWSALVFAAPQRLGNSLAGVFQTAAAPAGQGALATGLAALAGATMGGPPERASADADEARPALVREHLSGHQNGESRDAAAERKQGSQRRSAPRGLERRTNSRRVGSGRERRGPGTDRSRGGADGGGGSDPSGPSAPGVDGHPGGSPGSPGESPPAGGGGGTPPPPPPPPPDDPSPVLEVPEVQVPDVDVPIVETPEIDVPEVDVPGLSVPDAKIPSL